MKNSTLKIQPKPSGQEYWAKIIKESQESNLSNIDFCKEKGIAISAFYYWKKKITNVSVNRSEFSLIEIPASIQKVTGNNNDIISLSVNEDFRFHISFDLKTVLPIIQELFGKQK